MLTALPPRIQQKIELDGECWMWTAARNPKGYGISSLNGRFMLAHRLTYTLLMGEIPDGLHIDHLCKRPSCVNPAHMEPVTNIENLRRRDNYQDRITHCPSGHPYDEINTKTYRGRRYCRECGRIWSRERQRRRRAALREVSAPEVPK